MLAIEVELLTGRYVATAYNSRSGTEWPPHPARLFSALVATHFADEAPAPEERALLEWLERQGPPAICASEAAVRDVVTVFVPVNDVALTDVDDEAAAVEVARAELREREQVGDARGVKKAEKELAKTEQRYSGAVARATEVPTRSVNPKGAIAVLPETRVRQPRTFPSVAPADPRVTYVWPDADPTTAQLELLDRLLARIVRLGHSSSLVRADRIDGDVEPDWRPAEEGELTLRTVQVGQLQALESAYPLHGETEPRVMPCRFQAYTRRAPRLDREETRSVFSEDWIVLRQMGGPSLPMVACIGVARALRAALMSHGDQPAPEILSGHASAGLPLERDHLALVPLPFVGHRHASGSILGVALVLPREASEAERAAVYRALARWEDTQRQEDEDTPRLSLTLGRAGVLELERVEWGSVQASLRAGTWCRASKSWLSTTPMALDRFPGDLFARDPRKLEPALVEAADTVRRACERIGLPTPEHVEILPAAPWAGAAKARHYPPFPEQGSKQRRMLTHVRIDFAEPVRGPVLLGAGRYFGLGLFRPLERHG